MSSIVLASNNKGKLVELATLLAVCRIDVVPLARFTSESVAETGNTFLENALIKARHAAQVARMPAIADDSGLEVDALLGGPGVISARYAGEPSNDEANNRKLLAALNDVSDSARAARFRCVLAYVRNGDDPMPIIADASWQGSILRAPRGKNGFGYDPLFQPAGETRSSAELSVSEKNRVSHRAQAMRQLLDLLQSHGELRMSTS